MRIKSIAILAAASILFSCKKDITANDLISPLTLSSNQVLADGKTTLTITSKMNSQTDVDKRTVTFTASMGSFLGGTDSTITQKAVFINKELVASVNFIAPSSAGTVKITARAVPQDGYHDYSQTATITAIQSSPFKLSLSANGFAVKVGFGSDLTITGNLTNDTGTPASKGYKVKFEDTYLNNSAVGGSFRMLQTTSDGTGSVSAIYSPGNVAIGQQIIISCYLLDSSGEKTGLKNTIIINTIAN